MYTREFFEMQCDCGWMLIEFSESKGSCESLIADIVGGGRIYSLAEYSKNRAFYPKAPTHWKHEN